MPGSFRSDHRDIDSCGRLDGAEANVEAMREHQCFARLEMGSNGFVIKFLLLGVRHENHDHVGPCRGICRGLHREAIIFCLGAGGAGFGQSDADVAAAVAQIECVSVALRAVTENRNLFRLDECEVGILIVVELCHVLPFVGRFAAGKNLEVRYH